ncbi:MAG: Flp pilus assembly complex ATPase component TadA [Lentisphaeria bacterium]|nr:Flp pilus assembly complex ATPase component TadA [Lentisphaeria bacterium]
MTALLMQLQTEGALTPEQAQAAAKRVQRTGQQPEEAILALGFCTEEKIYRALSRTSRLPLCEASALHSTDEARSKIPQALSQRFQCLPLNLQDGVLTIAFAHPPLPTQLDQLRLLTGVTCRPILAMPSDLDAMLQQSYGLGAEKVRKIRDAKPLEESKQPEPRDAPPKTDEDSVSSLVNDILEAAIQANATDIHIEPFPGKLALRFRIDGLLQEVSTPPGMAPLGDAIVSRIKILAKLDIAERRLPHDGRLKMQCLGETRDLRVSILPTRHGESLCLRILNAGNLRMKMEELGLSTDHLKRLQDHLRHPNGLMLVTGPTGSGKTTTLYSILSHLMQARPDLKIITVEDPVEYEINGLTQVQIHAEIGLTFAATLRSILRHDPDVILVGEIRDRETAEIAIQAAQTGHLVLSTLHTNDAIGAVNRLINMGVEPDLVSTALRCVIAQRLVRRLCPNCSQEDTNVSPEDAQELSQAEKTLGMQKASPRRAAPGGCPHCRNTGYQGRVGIYEILEVNEELEDMIAANAANSQLRAEAAKHGWTPCRLDALRKVLLGITDLSELHRTC